MPWRGAHIVDHQWVFTAPAVVQRCHPRHRMKAPVECVLQKEFLVGHVAHLDGVVDVRDQHERFSLLQSQVETRGGELWTQNLHWHGTRWCGALLLGVLNTGHQQISRDHNLCIHMAVVTSDLIQQVNAQRFTGFHTHQLDLETMTRQIIGKEKASTFLEDVESQIRCGAQDSPKQSFSHREEGPPIQGTCVELIDPSMN
mmetsp:Transcript_3164/g.7714  ORF Transcript_3164/g.7714 Transcript_3164/m.7714 type:complete len:200 (-) Transcript_3164:263-862(-)